MKMFSIWALESPAMLLTSFEERGTHKQKKGGPKLRPAPLFLRDLPPLTELAAGLRLLQELVQLAGVDRIAKGLKRRHQVGK